MLLIVLLLFIGIFGGAILLVSYPAEAINLLLK